MLLILFKGVRGFVCISYEVLLGGWNFCFHLEQLIHFTSKETISFLNYFEVLCFHKKKKNTFSKFSWSETYVLDIGPMHL